MNNEISKLKKEMEELKVQLEDLKKYKMRSVLLEEASFESMVVSDENKTCIDCNEQTLRTFQYTREELVGKNIIFLVASESKEQVIEKFFLKNSNAYEALMIRKDGSKFWGLIHGENVIYEGEKLRITTCRDITFQKNIQRELFQKNEEFESIFNNSQVGIVLLDKKRIIRRVNKKFNEIIKNSYNVKIEGRSIEEFHVSKESYEKFGKYYHSALIERRPIKLDYKFKNMRGEITWMSVSGSLVDKNNPPDIKKGIIWIFEDINKRKLMEQKLKEAYEELKIIFDNTMVGILVLHKGRVIHKANHAFIEMMGYDSIEEFKGKSSNGFHLSEELSEEFSKRFDEYLINRKMFEVDYQVKRKDGTSLWVSISGRAIDRNIPADLELGVVWVTRDISKRKKVENELINLSRIDDLTGIFNRRYFWELSKYELSIHRRYKRNFSFLMLDIDYFKKINDLFGHAVGDKALLCFVEVCKKEIRETDIFARLGGEEFGIALLESNLEDSVAIANRIRLRLVKETSKREDEIQPMTVSIGAVMLKENEDLAEAIHRADLLLYKAKKNGRNKVCF